MTEAEPVTVERAREALEDMDDYARMDAGVDAKGPRETLERFIAEHERALAELRAENERLRKSRNEFYHAAEGRRLANSDLRRRNAELQARVAELEADARRYRWWRENIECLFDDGDGIAGVAFSYQINVLGNFTDAELVDAIADAAIDAARQQENA